MNIVEKHIRHFNRLSGNEITVKKLRKFYDQVKSENKIELKELEEKLAKAVKKAKTKVRLAFKPLPIPKNRSSAKEPKFITVDESYLNGIEQIQDDADYIDDDLDGLSDMTYKVITDRIMELMKGGNLIWRKPWNNKVNGPTDLAHNHVTRHMYRGINYYLNFLRFGLKYRGKTYKFESPMYFTFNQVDKLGGKVKKGAKGWPVVYFKWLYKEIKTDNLVDVDIATSGGNLKPGYDRFPALFYYTVYNYEQCEGLKIRPQKTRKRSEIEKVESAEQIIDEMPKPPKILRKRGDDAYYSPASDYIVVPLIDQFKVPGEFYCTLFHEIVHSTGHESRLNRDFNVGRKFGDKKYAFEELIAELGASFLCGESGILYYTMNNSAAYIKNWASVLHQEMTNDPKFFLRAASQAQRASDFILGRKESELKEADPKHTQAKKPSKQREPVQRKPAKKDIVSSKSTKLSGIVTADQIAGLEFKEIPIDGKYKQTFNKLTNDTKIMIWGVPGSGKTVYVLELAQYLAQHKNMNVLYIAAEELGRSTFTDKIKQFNIGHKNLHFVRNFKELEAAGHKLDDYDVIIMDSVQKLGMDLKEYCEFAEQYPHKMHIIIIQSTKDGDFRGGKDWEHEVDIAGEVVNRSMILRKNRNDEHFVKKSDKLRMQELIRQKERDAIIKQSVKAKVKQKKELQPVHHDKAK